MGGLNGNAIERLNTLVWQLQCNIFISHWTCGSIPVLTHYLPSQVKQEEFASWYGDNGQISIGGECMMDELSHCFHT